jgi:GH15 family glucan-1,4-alpha-glucosidase
MEPGWSSDREAFVQHDGDHVLDAAVLMMPLLNFIAPTDPRWLSSLDALGADLVSDSLVHRYDPQASPDGPSERRGNLLDLVLLVRRGANPDGRLDEAPLALEKMLIYANHVGLYAEQIAHTGEQLGNLPQPSPISR